MPLLPVDDLNAATPLSEVRGDVVPVESFYIRSNFEIPRIDVSLWALDIRGAVENPYRVDLAVLQAMSVVGRRVVLECAGNFRTLMEPVPGGTPWGIGAAAVADFTGVPVDEVLRAARPSTDVVEWVFVGSDRGLVEPDGEIPYAFPLEVEVADAGGAMLVWEMNGMPLTPEHGGPVRLVVPGHYGMRSVKWLAAAEAVVAPFEGHFRRKYRYYGSSTEPEGAPVDRVRVRSMVSEPESGEVATGPLEVSGVAWSGHGAIRTVEVRLDDGDWMVADIEPGAGVHAMARWSIVLQVPPGAHQIAARATDAAGTTQPETPPWNSNGYGNNVIHTVSVQARE